LQTTKPWQKSCTKTTPPFSSSRMQVLTSVHTSASHVVSACFACNGLLLCQVHLCFIVLSVCVYAHAAIAEFDLILRDACYWPAAFLQDILEISSVELWPVVILMPWLWESEFSLPNPVAYLPQVGMDLTPNMVSCFPRTMFVAHRIPPH